MTTDNKLLTVKEAAERLGVSASYLNKVRTMASGSPPFVRIGRRVLYDSRDLTAFVDAQKSGAVAASPEAGQ